MACIARRPRCGTLEGSTIPEPLGKIISIIGSIAGLAGIAGGVFKGLAEAGTIAASLGGFASGVLVGLVVYIVILVLVASYFTDRCISTEGLSECVAGVVNEIVQDFSEWTEELFPFTAMHDRIDVIVKSRYWDIVEDGNAKVLCTSDAPPRRSEIMRCYFRTPRVCDTIEGALYGTVAGGVAGIVAAAAVAAAVGCATVILCIFALILAALVAAVAVLVGALVGGQIAKAASDDTSPSDAAGTTIAVGDLITVKGNMVRREYDETANVMWWVRSSALSGRVPDGTPSNPFSYCEIDDIFTMDGCPAPPII